MAWASLGSQVLVLLGSEGLYPAPVSDPVLGVGCMVGAVLGICSLAGVVPRACSLLSGALYIPYIHWAGDLLAFQWDSLLIECCLLAAFLPRSGSWAMTWLFRLLLLKLYLESGIAKWQSHEGDWHDGSAMVDYFETAPLPTALAWFAHHLPESWHHFESRFTLFFECALPLAMFFGRRGRRLVLVVLTGFQLINAATANYGFFIPLALALHLWLLESDRAVEPRWRWAPLLLWSLISLDLGLERFAGGRSLTPDVVRQLRLVNNYHLFGHITNDRLEPELQLQVDGIWQAAHLRYKPGPLDRSPPFVAPHQPRVDFRLWFFGLGFQRGAPPYVLRLHDRVCSKPEAIQPLFVDPLPEVDATRWVFWRYTFANPEERDQTGNWWNRSVIARTEGVPCL